MCNNLVLNFTQYNRIKISQSISIYTTSYLTMDTIRKKNTVWICISPYLSGFQCVHKRKMVRRTWNPQSWIFFISIQNEGLWQNLKNIQHAPQDTTVPQQMGKSVKLQFCFVSTKSKSHNICDWLHPTLCPTQPPNYLSNSTEQSPSWKDNS